MLIDDVTILVSAGKGGDGAITYRKEKFVPRGGPDGGNGGRGGSISVLGVSSIDALKQFRYRKEIKADNGEGGKSKKMHGKNAENLVIRVPVGSIIRDLEDDTVVWEVTAPGEEFVLVRGGRGGRGNHEFRTSENKTPDFAEEGRRGQSRTLHINLQFIADVGLIGLPSAGKSSLLNVLTNADVKIGAYDFTTLEPHLGVSDRIVIADIPGLIEGAHEGKGLGIKFLKHIEKTSLLLHCIDSTIENVEQSYKVIRKELEEYSQNLAEKREIILLTKSDLIDDEKELKEKTKILKRFTKNILVCSIADDASIEKLKATLQKEVKK